MGPYFDLHSHMLCRVDDGAKDEEEMFKMLETAYADGVRGLCLTPHFSPEMFGDTVEKSKKSFEILSRYVEEKHPDMKLFLGNELGYYDGCLRALESGLCRTIAGSRYVLVDFSEFVEFRTLTQGLSLLQRSGFRVILAHAERYRCLARQFQWLEEFVDAGGIVQLNASSGSGGWGFAAKSQWKKILKLGLGRIISTDAHNLTRRPPKFSVCTDFLEEHCSEELIRLLTWENAKRVTEDLPI